jgi:hypothetical protein
MKKLVASIAFILLTVSLSFGQKINFKTLEIDYGRIEKGSDGTREFIFTNDGKAPLIIQNAQGSCGCTVPTFPKEPIMPGQKNKISVKYDTQREGKFTKFVTLTTNSENETSTKLTITGEVMPDKNKDKVVEEIKK